MELHASVEVIREFLFHRLRRDHRGQALADARAVRDALVLHPFDATVASRMLDLVEETGVRGRAAVHAATALGAGFDHIVSTDPDLDVVPGLTRVAPQSLAPRPPDAAE